MLRRFLVIHFCLPFVVVLIGALHLAALHSFGSSDSGSCQCSQSSLDHFSSYYYKDLWFLQWFVVVFLGLLFVFADTLGHADQFCWADRLATPGHIVPEWYFLPFYAVLRCCASKSSGVVLLVGSVLQLIFLLHSSVGFRSSSGALELSVGAFFLLLIVLLGLVGSGPPFYPWVDWGCWLVFLLFLAA